MARNVLRSQQFSREFVEGWLFPKADNIRSMMACEQGRSVLRKKLEGKILLSLFFEPSSRTRFSFEIAAIRLGMTTVATENAEVFSSFAKGESLEDGLEVISGYRPDVIVMRHHETGAVEKAARASCMPVINAGDGKGQHPTQALLDLYTIKAELGGIDGLTVVLGGDLAHGRTVRSLAYLLSRFRDIRLIFVSPPSLAMRQDIKDHLTEKGVSFWETQNLKAGLEAADVVYWTRTQTERMSEDESRPSKSPFSIGLRQMTWMKPKAILMHPLPRKEELRPECDADPRAAYFRQAENGLYIRAALLIWVLGENQDSSQLYLDFSGK